MAGSGSHFEMLKKSYYQLVQKCIRNQNRKKRKWKFFILVSYLFIQFKSLLEGLGAMLEVWSNPTPQKLQKDLKLREIQKGWNAIL